MTRKSPTNVAPRRSVVKIDELQGPKGGIVYVLQLSCGCWRTQRSPAKEVSCAACWVMEQRMRSAPVRARGELEKEILDKLPSWAAMIRHTVPDMPAASLEILLHHINAGLDTLRSKIYRKE